MNLVKRSFVTAVGAAALALIAVTPASAHFCSNVSKQAGAGSISTLNIATGQFTENQKNGGFVTITDGTFSYDVFLHQMLPDGALAAGPDGDDACDGRAVDFALACLGITV
ncbi:MAG: hypothetical protein M3R02_21760 [Chloroflexota bacterium]|nr:hypothetical protein [Chloroflexota bacterium]